MAAIKPLIEVVEQPIRKLRLNFHAGQWRVWQSQARIVCACAGTQSGKTVLGPLWLRREIQLRGPGAYGVVGPTFSLMDKKALPEFLNLFSVLLRLGTYHTTQRVFTISKAGELQLFGHNPTTPTQIWFGYAENPDSLESATYKAVVCDEAGQKSFKTDSYYALRRRLAIHEGRMFIGTTPYSNKGWLRAEIYDKWKSGDKSIDFIRFSSTMNPAFPRAEYEWAVANLPTWKWRMQYDGAFERPAGIIYDCFREDPGPAGPPHKTPRFEIPDKWQRYLGLDFGGVNTAAVFFAEEPRTKRWYAYREYKAGGRTAREHAQALREKEPMVPICFGGSLSEGQWRDEFRAAGLPVREPDQKSIEVGIDRVYGAIKRNELFVFSDLAGVIEEFGTYSRKVDERGDPTEVIDDQHSFHYLDAVRYVVSPMKREAPKVKIGIAPRGEGNVVDAAPVGVF